jgi:FixJ family two-component response regulator
VVDDAPAVQTQIAAIVVDMGCEHVGFLSAREFLDQFDERLVNCVVLDLYLPDGTGLEILQELSLRASAVPVVFMSSRAQVSEAVASLQLGSIDFLEKPFPSEKMRQSLVAALALDARQRSAGAEVASCRARLAGLTGRETDVLHRIVWGAASKQVARELGISQKTVEAHRARIMLKTRAESLAELVRLYLAAGMQP